MTPEEITKLRDMCNSATPGPLSAAWIAYALRLARKTGLDFGDVESDTSLNSAREDDAKLFSAARTLIPQLLDALEAAERERDEAREASAAKSAALKGAMNAASSMAAERDEARARLAEADALIEEARK